MFKRAFGGLLASLVFFSFQAVSQSYQQIHEKAIVVDTHNDVLSEVTMKGMDIEKDLSGRAHSDLARFKKGGVDIQVFSIFCDQRFGRDTAYKYANIEIDSLYAIVARNPQRMMIVTSPSALEKAVQQHKLGCMMGVEGGHMIEDNLSYLDAFYQRGVRYLTLTWNNSTSWSTSAMDETLHADSLPHKGLTAFGRQVVRRMNQLGMIVDLSHVGEQTFWDAIRLSTKPVIASHSCAYHLCPVFRNLKDDQIRAIGKNGGLIDLNFFSGFVDSNYQKRQQAFNARHQHQIDSLKKLSWASYEVEDWLARAYPGEAASIRPTLDQLLDHLDYIVHLVGVDHVGLGSDFDGISSAPQGLDDVSSFPNLTRALVQRGYSEKDIDKILGGNFIRVFRANAPGKNQ